MIADKKFIHNFIFTLIALYCIGSFFYTNNAYAANSLEVSLVSPKYDQCLQMDISKRIGNNYNIRAANCQFKQSNMRWSMKGDTIRTTYNGQTFCLEAMSQSRGGNIVAAACNNSANQTFDRNPKTLRIHSKVKSDYCLDVASSRDVKLYDCHNGLHQVWYADVNLASSKNNIGCIDVESTNNVSAWKTCVAKSTDQTWDIATKRISVVHKGDRYCLSAQRSNSANVTVARCSTSDTNQHFEIGSRGSIIAPRSSGQPLCLDVVATRNGNTNNVILWNCHHGVNQQWGYQTFSTPNFGAFQCKRTMDINGCDAVADREKAIFKAQCNNHDSCYRTPWRGDGISDTEGRLTCEDNFAKDLTNRCIQNYSNVVEEAFCLTKANAMVVAVTVAAGANGSYSNGQNWSSQHCFK